MKEGWSIYNYAFLPTTAPHEEAEVDVLLEGKVWSEGKAFMARYTTDFDCGYETEWWYCIKDDPIDISKLKKKRRYEITRALKNIDVKIINPMNYKDEIFNNTMECFDEYPKQYKPNINYNTFSGEIKMWSQSAICFGAFLKNSGEFLGYAICFLRKEYVSLAHLKVPSKYHSLGTNAALVYAVCTEFLNSNKYNIKYVSDGARNIRHKTNFQTYLEKYFGFRKAYCKLNIVYRPFFKYAINLLYPFRNLIQLFGKQKHIYNLSCLLKQEEIHRSFKRN
ncbi:hypothetical protein D3H55_06235 [Bacillus salacetis]|uniref:Uncharacterized protein n=1 Tax=Bacillus salacetis TaxID=2315464 RepID=A0A3A1R3P2_9BACI|nr:hypothetical protein [Bacillus salacetis]RIW36055.1 hypothetical protein D3H55_06235 [Bacillus salacetis]